MFANPLGLDSLYSWGLLAIGLVCAIAAAISAFRMDDPFPGYGAVSRRHRERCEVYAAEVEVATREMQRIRNDAVTETETVRNQLGQQFRERERILNASDALRRRYDEHGAQLEQVANALLETYRAANRAARTEAAPAHFGHRWTLPRRPLEELNVPAADKAALEASETALGHAITEIARAFEDANTRFESLEILKQRLVHEAQ